MNKEEILLSFFRDLTPLQRLNLFVHYECFPDDWNGQFSIDYQRKMLHNIIDDLHNDANHQEYVLSKEEQAAFHSALRRSVKVIKEAD